MGNCLSPSKKTKPKNKRERRPNPYASSPSPIQVVKQVLPHGPNKNTKIGDKYMLSRELGRGEFGTTYLCIDKQTRDALACKSILKKKLRTSVDVEDVRREVAIMSSLPEHDNIVKLKATYEDNEAVHLVMELCEGGELFDRIVARGHYSERAAAGIAKTVAEVVRMCHECGVIHRDLKPENFLFANKKENSPLKAIDFGLSVFFKPGTVIAEHLTIEEVEADVDGNGVLNYGEFVAVTIHLQRMENDEHFRKAFTFFDKNGNGCIELDELRDALADESGETDEDVLHEIMQEVDTNKDGQISYDEFVAMMKAGTDWRKASRQYSRERFQSLSVNLMKDGSLHLQDTVTGQTYVV
ncbi:hypothetical protein AG4045_007736 [Apium graveolens]|uniref:non-specific serine/threonine protein kinase n=1 Tax=Apium graveolens TaxID=4045 RepID=A0A6L5BBF9_APIGR|nr:hypothetical protein AG4045_007736 [Apium graveolens]